MSGTIDDFLNQGSAALGGWDPDSKNWDKYYQQAEQKYPNVPKGLLKAVVATESSGNPGAVSKAGAQGAAQFMPATAGALGVNPWDPESSIDGAAKLLSQTLKSNGGNVNNALQQYQGGPDTSKWGKENAAYPGEVLSHFDGDPKSLTTVQSTPEGIQSDSTSTYSAPAAGTKSYSLDDFMSDGTKALSPDDAQAAPAPPSQTPAPALTPDQSTQLAGIIAHPSQPDVLPPPQQQPQSAPGPMASGPTPVPLAPPPGISGGAPPPQLAPPPAPSAGGPAPTAIAPPPPLAAPNPVTGPQSAMATADPMADPRYAQLHPDQTWAAANAPAPQPVVAPPSAAELPNINDGWDGSKELANSIGLGLPKYLAGAIGGGISALQGKGFGAGYSADMAVQNQAQQAYEAAHPKAALGDQILGSIPLTMLGVGAAGAGVRAAADLLPDAVGPVSRFLLGDGGKALDAASGRYLASPGAGNALAGIASKGLSGVAQGATVGALDSQISPSQGTFGQQVKKAAIAGGLLGPVAAAVGRVALPAVDPARRALANTLKSQFGVDLPTGQIVPGSSVGKIAGSGETETLAQNTDTLHNAIGGSGPITPQALQDAKTRIGQQIDQVNARIGIATTNPAIRIPLKNQLAAISQQAQQNYVQGAPGYNELRNAFNVLNQTVNSGKDLDGPALQRLTQKTNSLIGNLRASTAPGVAQIGKSINQALDSAATSTGISTGNKAALAEKTVLMDQYRLASKLTAPASMAGPSGILNPPLVANALKGETGTLAPLAQAQRLLPRATPSGQAVNPGSKIMHVATHYMIPALAGGALVHGAGGGELATAAAALAGGGLEHGAKAIVNSAPYRNLLLGTGRSFPSPALPLVNGALNSPASYGQSNSLAGQAPAVTNWQGSGGGGTP